MGKPNPGYFYEIRTFNEKKCLIESTGPCSLDELAGLGYELGGGKTDKFYFVHVPEMGAPAITEFATLQELMQQLEQVLPVPEKEKVLLFCGSMMNIGDPKMAVQVEIKAGKFVNVPVGKKKEEPKKDEKKPEVKKEEPKVEKKPEPKKEGGDEPKPAAS